MTQTREERLQQIRDCGKDWYRRNRERVLARQRDRYRVRRYGLSADDYAQMVARQRGRCAICERVQPLKVDHNHTTGEVRSLLCITCNFLVGFLERNRHLLAVAFDYLSEAAVFPEKDDTVEAA